jgi:signal transduction histidine kinase
MRNPLTTIRVLVQTAAEQDDGLRGHDLAIVEEEITRLDKTIQTLLDFAQGSGVRSPELGVRSDQVNSTQY